MSDTFTECFSPRTVATYNSNDIVMAKLDGQFHWHKHDNTDDFFVVLKGTLDIELRDRTLNLGDIFVVPTGVEHRPVVRGEVHLLLIEPTGTSNTGDKTTAAPRILARPLFGAHNGKTISSGQCPFGIIRPNGGQWADRWDLGRVLAWLTSGFGSSVFYCWRAAPRSRGRRIRR